MAIAPPNSSKKPTSKRCTSTGNGPRAVFWAALACCILLFSGVAWFVLSGLRDGGDDPAERSRAGLIAGVDPAHVPSPDAATPGVADAADAAEGAASTNASAIAQDDKPKSFRIVKPKNGGKRLFHTISDVYISRLVNATPGRAMIGTMNYDRFAEQFKQSLDTPIVIEEGDTPEEVAAKQNVIETREELRRRMEQGEDIAQLMRETESELRRLYNYRQNLSKELAQAFRDRKFTADDMQDYIDAANKMLKDNEMEPLKHPEFWVRQMRLAEAAGQ